MNSKSLLNEAEISTGINNMVVTLDGAQDVTIVATYATDLKIQGSTDDGATYNDIENSAVSGDGTVNEPLAVGLYRPIFDKIKVVMVSAAAKTASAVVMVRNTRQSVDIATDGTQVLCINPQIGTA